MISKLSQLLAARLINQKSIDETERELYEYGFFLLFSNILLLCIACLTGLIFRVFLQSVLFYLAFIFIRQYGGGYHAKTELRCQLASTFSIVFCIILIRLSVNTDLMIPFIILSVVSSAAILMFAPLDTPEKPLSAQERAHFRKITYIILFILDAAFLIGCVFKLKLLYSPICLSLTLEGILISLGRLAKKSRSPMNGYN